MKLNRNLAICTIIALAATVFCSQATAQGYKCAACGKSFPSMQAALGHSCKNNSGAYKSSPYPKQNNSYNQQSSNTQKTTTTTKNTQKKATTKQTTTKQTATKQTTTKQTATKQTATKSTTATNAKTYKEFEAKITMQCQISSHYKPTLSLGGSNVNAEFIFLTRIKAGETKTVKVKLSTAKAVKVGDTFSIVENGKKVG
ncbi:MAG: hypothetical protein IK092_06910, partial [Muribaculaceae bacterium]|nr:hypothetical protein [Muribaculaceae bacterium]